MAEWKVKNNNIIDNAKMSNNVISDGRNTISVDYSIVQVRAVIIFWYFLSFQFCGNHLPLHVNWLILSRSVLRSLRIIFILIFSDFFRRRLYCCHCYALFIFQHRIIDEIVASLEFDFCRKSSETLWNEKRCRQPLINQNAMT